MDKETFTLLENYMGICMEDSAHDKAHIYRVLYHALDIAKSEPDVNYDVLICACLLHDIGRKEQYENSALCHAVIGGQKAYGFLVNNHFDPQFASHVQKCIETHRYRSNNPPQTIEAKILFDADKLDATGAMGIARTLLYQGNVSDPLYTLNPDGSVSDGTTDSSPSFFREYKYKLEKVYGRFYTTRAKALAAQHQDAAVNFYHNLLTEVTSAYSIGHSQLNAILEE